MTNTISDFVLYFVTGGTADYAFAMLFAMVVILATYPLLMSVIPPLFCRNLVYFVLYVWSRRHPTSQANIWGIPMKAMVRVIY